MLWLQLCELKKKNMDKDWKWAGKSENRWHIINSVWDFIFASVILI